MSTELCANLHISLTAQQTRIFLQGCYTRAIQLYDKWTVSSEKSEGGGSIVGEEIFSMAPSVHRWIIQYGGAPSKNSQGAPTLDQLIR